VLIGLSAKVPDVAARLVPAHYTTALGLLTRLSTRRAG
jgi:hypothetical protein